MATTGDGVSAYQSGGAGGKFRKRPNRRSASSTPYDRPPTALRNKSPGLLAKLVDPASRLIYAGADRLFGVFRKRLPSISAQRLPGTSEEPRNGPHDSVPISASKNSTEVVEPRTNEDGNLSSIPVATELSDLENMLKQKTFTRSEIERLTALLLSKTTDSNAVEVDKEKLPSTSYHVPKPDALITSGTLNKHAQETEIRNFDAAISTPAVSLRAFEDDGASPADLAKAYMGTRSTKLSPITMRPNSYALKQDSLLYNNTFNVPKTPTASLALAPLTTPSIKTSENGLTTFRSRGRSALYNMPRTPYYRGPSTLSQKGVVSPSVWESEGSIGSSRMAAKRRSSVLDDIGSGGPMRRIRQKASLSSKHTSEPGSSQKLLLRNEPDPKGKKVVEETGEISKRNQSYGSVPTESSKMALKIFEQLDRMSPKEKPTASKLALTTEKNNSPKSLLTSQDNKKPEVKNRVLFPDTRESTFQSKDTVKENGSRNIGGNSNVLSSVNGNVTVPVTGNASAVAKAGSTTKRTFSMSAHEDTLELDDDKHSNGHVTVSPTENKKPVTSVLANNDVSTPAHTETIQTSAQSKVGQTVLPEVDSIPKKPEFKKDAISPEGSVINNQKTSLNFPVISQPTSTADTVTPQNKPTVFPTFGITTHNNVGPDGDKPKPKPVSPDATSLGPTSLKNSTMNNDQVQFPTFDKKVDNVNTQKPINLVGNSGPSSTSVNLTTKPASGVFAFGGSTNNSSTMNGTSASSPSVFASSSSFQSSASSSLFSSAATAFLTTTTTAATTAATSAASSALATSVSAPVFKFGSTTASSTSTTLSPPSPFSSSSFATSNNNGSIFGLNPPSTTLTTNGFQTTALAASTAVTQSVPFKFGSVTTAMLSSTSANSLFNSSAPSFATSAETKSGSSISLTPFSFGASSTISTPAAASSPFMFGSSNAGASTGSPVFSFSSKPVSNTLVFETSSPNNNDNMSMEDNMVDDTKQTPSPPLPSFTQPFTSTPGFMFGSGATSAPFTPPPPTVGFQFSGQISQPQPQPQPFSQNVFQPPGGSPFNAGGSFSLGSGGDDKSSRRIVKVKRQNRRK